MAPKPNDSLEALLAREAIVETIVTMGIATDARDWPTVRECFADEVLFDMSSLSGSTPQKLSPADIANGWEQGLRPIQQVHHQFGNFRVRLEGDEATASCYGVAYHFLPKPSGRNTRTFVGAYEFRLRRDLARWRISEFRFAVKFVDGNLKLEDPE